jgi:Tfp pilus assembly protein PilF/TolB-like protein
LYTSLYGERPFRGETLDELRASIAKGDVRVPGRPHVAPRVRRALRRGLRADPDDRHPSMSDLLAEIGKGPGGWRPFTLGIVVALVAVVGIGVVRWKSGAAHPASAVADAAAPAAQVTVRPGAAVLPLGDESRGTSAAWVGGALADMLRTELSNGGALRVATGDATARVLRDFSVATSVDLAPPDAARVGEALGAAFVVDGGYLLVDGAPPRRLRIDLHLKNAQGETVASYVETGTEQELIDLVARAAVRLREALHVAEPDHAADTALPARSPAREPYTRGLALLRAFDARAARAELERALALDPSFPLAHASLAEALFTLGYVAAAAEESHKALDLAGNMAQEHRLRIEAEYDERTYAWAKAADRYRVLFEFFPDDVDYGLSLMRTYVKAGEAKKASDVAAALRRLPPPLGSDPRIDLAEAEVANVTGDYARQRSLAEAAETKARASGARAVLVEASSALARARLNSQKAAGPALADEFRRIERLYLELGNRSAAAFTAARAGFALFQADDMDGAFRETRRALETAKDIGHRALEGRLEMQLGIFYKRSDLTLSRQHLANAIAIAKECGEKLLLGTSLNNVGLCDWHDGKLPSARQSFEAAIEVFAAIGAAQDADGARDNLAMVLGDLGEADEAIRIHEQMLKRFQERQLVDDVVITLHSIASLELKLGDVAGATARLDEGERIAKPLQDRENLAQIKSLRAQLAAMKGDLETARRLMREAIEERKNSGTSRNPGGWELELARMDLEAGVARTAEIKGWAAQRESDPIAHATLAWSLALDGSTAEATSAVERSLAVATKTDAYFARVSAQLLAARVLLVLDKPERAIAVARPLVAAAQAHGAIRWELEARLIVARAEKANEALDAVARAAKERGLTAIERRARAD